MNEEPLRIGKIKKAVEERLEIDIGDDHYVYMLSEALDAFAKAYPETYLAKLEGLREVLSHPDFIHYEDKAIILDRFYCNKGKYSIVRLRIEKHQKWLFSSLESKSFRFEERDSDALRLA